MKNKNKIIIWDLSLRLFHIILILLVTGAIISAKFDRLDIHQYFGVMILGLLFFRILWGVFGTYNSTFKSFVLSPYKIYLIFLGKHQKKSIRSPLGSFSVISFIFALFILVVSGLFSSDDVFYDGPLVYLMPKYTYFWTQVHNIFHFVLYVLITFHFSAIFYYQFIKKHQIIQQFIDGYSRGNHIDIVSIKEKPLKGIFLLLIFIFLPIILLLYS
jgi:cytochrome b